MSPKSVKYVDRLELSPFFPISHFDFLEVPTQELQSILASVSHFKPKALNEPSLEK